MTAADLNAEYNNILNDYNGSISTANFSTTLTWGATGNQYLDISAIASSTTKGLRLPTGSTGGTNAGQLAWDNTAKALRVGDGAAADFDALTAAQGTAGQLLRSGGANALDTWTTPTYPNAAGTAGVIIRSDGTNFGTSTPTFPNTGGTAGQWLRTDGTNYGLSTPTLPNTATDDSALVGDGTNWVATAVTNCTDTGGNHLNYTAASNTFSCGTSGGTPSVLSGTFTRDISLTTTLTVTTTAITPRFCHFQMTNNAGGNQFAVGFSNSTPGAGITAWSNAGGTAGNFDSNSSGVWMMNTSAGNQTEASMSSYASGSYTLAFTKTGSPTGTAAVNWGCSP